jgi:hypothetical protein
VTNQERLSAGLVSSDTEVASAMFKSVEPQPKAGKGSVLKFSVARRLPKFGGRSGRFIVATLPSAVSDAGGVVPVSVAPFGRKSTTCTPVAASGPRLATVTS